MTDWIQAIKDRRSVRKFEEQPLSEDQIQTLLESVRWSASWANTQCWEVVVVRDEQIKSQLQETMAKGNPGTNAVVQAPVVFALCAKLQTSGYYKGQAPTKFGDWFMFDLGLAAQNLCLAAHAMGLGSVMLGLFDHDQAARALKMPEAMELVTLIPVGVPAKVPSPPKRREIEEFTHWDTF
ncbi:nitroreductase family protein [Desulfovermiculus halophilus]|jgi:nitroreductase|uniref:nitroreductase family protein n=1 Tax=Desulfovermiculus halophilus TaxID=339722 RepID=UPI000481E454|nr:nitroreductase family protein [Desulfovermiculus halophilus]